MASGHMQPAFARVLSNKEILSNLLSDKHLDRNAIVTATRVCRAWSSIALDELYRDVDWTDLDNVLAILGEMDGKVVVSQNYSLHAEVSSFNSLAFSPSHRLRSIRTLCKTRQTAHCKFPTRMPLRIYCCDMSMAHAVLEFGQIDVAVKFLSFHALHAPTISARTLYKGFACNLIAMVL